MEKDYRGGEIVFTPLLVLVIMLRKKEQNMITMQQTPSQ